MNIKIGILNVPKHCNKHDLKAGCDSIFFL